MSHLEELFLFSRITTSRTSPERLRYCHTNGEVAGAALRAKKLNPVMKIGKDRESHLDEVEPRWFAVCTKYKREKLVQKRLSEQGIQVYLPLQHCTRRYTRKVRTVELPLISCYVFTRITQKSYARVLNTPDVLHFVKFSQNLIAIPEREILLLQRIVGEEVDIEVEPANYQVGEEVEIAAGSLIGIRGILLEQGKKKHFVVELKSIGCSLRIEIDPAMLKKTPAAARWREQKTSRLRPSHQF
jgi:transcription antitermination factor NusG